MAKAIRYGINFHEVSRHQPEESQILLNFDRFRAILGKPDVDNFDLTRLQSTHAGAALKKKGVLTFELQSEEFFNIWMEANL